ncbi:DNA primase [Actinobacillus equuli]|nr:DNA primase [Actinobacillus equuli]
MEKRIEVLIAKDRTVGLNAEEKQELVMLIAQ